MRKPLVALLASTAIVFAACGGATTPSPSATEPAATTTPTEGPSPTPTVRLDDSTYGTRVEEGTDGGQIIIGDWQEAAVRTLRALDAWFFADAAHPLVGARRCVSRLAGLPALESTRVDVLTPAEQRPEERDLLLRRGEVMHETRGLPH